MKAKDFVKILKNSGIEYLPTENIKIQIFNIQIDISDLKVRKETDSILIEFEKERK